MIAERQLSLFAVVGIADQLADRRRLPASGAERLLAELIRRGLAEPALRPAAALALALDDQRAAMARGPPDDLAESGMNECAKCGRQRLLVALHGNRGGPEVCIECSGELLTVAKERRRHADRMRRGHENALKDVLSRRAVEDGAIAERMDASYLAELLDDKVLEDLIHWRIPTGIRRRARQPRLVPRPL